VAEQAGIGAKLTMVRTWAEHADDAVGDTDRDQAVTIGIIAANSAPKARPSTIRARMIPSTVLAEAFGWIFSIASQESWVFRLIG
jgi:hypothetical protein